MDLSSISVNVIIISGHKVTYEGREIVGTVKGRELGIEPKLNRGRLEYSLPFLQGVGGSMQAEGIRSLTVLVDADHTHVLANYPPGKGQNKCCVTDPCGLSTHCGPAGTCANCNQEENCC